MKEREITLEALIKQIKSMKQTGTNNVAVALSMLGERLQMLETMVDTDLFRQATKDLYYAGIELSKMRVKARRVAIIYGLASGFASSLIIVGLYGWIGR